jgi:hypothetical protein
LDEWLSGRGNLSSHLFYGNPQFGRDLRIMRCLPRGYHSFHNIMVGKKLFSNR